MLQSIEKKREMKSSESAVTVMFNDRRRVLGGVEAFRARENAAPSLSELLAVVSVFVSDASPRSGLWPLVREIPSRVRTRSRSLSDTEIFSAEEPLARSALAVLPVDPNTRGAQVAAPVITKLTEQRRCEAA